MALVCLVQNFQLINSRLFLGVSHSGSMTFWVNGFKRLFSLFFRRTWGDDPFDEDILQPG